MQTASYQRVALFLLFDAIERDLINHIEAIDLPGREDILLKKEVEKATARLQNQSGTLESADLRDLLFQLDLGDKLAILGRHRNRLSSSDSEYFLSALPRLMAAITARNAVMHGRPITVTEYSIGFALANDLVNYSRFWPTLNASYKEFTSNPDGFIRTSIQFLDETRLAETLNNLPDPDYDDTGFLSRPALEKDLKKKILGRHPVVTILGDGGNGKTALALHVLYGLLDSTDHGFDAIVWVSAKSSHLSGQEIERIEGAITNSLGLFSAVADLMEPGDEAPLLRVRRLLADNKILLVIDNLETVLDRELQDFAADVPGDSKLLLTSRIPLGSDLTVYVDKFSPEDAVAFYYRLADAYSDPSLRAIPKKKLLAYFEILDRKPLLIKWFALGIQSGLSPDAIVANPSIALQFCMGNILDRLTPDARRLAAVMTLLGHSLSIAILEHVTELSAKAVEQGVSELLRYGLIEAQESPLLERRYRVKPFATTYIAQVTRLDEDDSKHILGKYREVEAAFQFESAGLQNRFDARTFTVRSPTEAIAARKLRNAVILAFRGRFADAQVEVDELKTTTPQYFEVWRVDGFISYRAGDYLKARAGYESALALAPDEAQLHYFYGQFLTRVFSDFAAAEDHFDQSLRLSGDSFDVLLEAARNCFFKYDFDKAQNFIFRAWAIRSLSAEQKEKLFDTNAQLYTRKSEYMFDNRKTVEAAQTLEQLYSLVKQYNIDAFDEILIGHLAKAIPTIDNVLAHEFGKESRDNIYILREFIVNMTNVSRQVEIEKSKPLATRFFSGRMKQGSVHEKFLFLRDHWKEDTYLSRSTVQEDLWVDICAGVQVMYEVGTNKDGQRFAKNVTRV